MPPPSSDLGFLLQGQSLEVLIDSQESESEDGGAAAAPLRLGIVSMVKQPGEAVLETWLTYHAEELGVERFFLRIEDTPELELLLCQPPWDACVTATFHETTERDWSGVAARQATHARSAIDAARRDGLTHLLHLDVDEALYCPNGPAALRRAIARAPADAVSLHARNLEAVVTSVRCSNPFAEARAFRHRPWDYGAYGYPPSSGKSIGVLRCPQLW